MCKSSGVSVIIPLYNAEKYVQSLVENLAKADAAEVEFIFVNDGSTDRTKELCEAAKEQLSHLTVIHQPNGGASSARNAGLDAACGEFICFADCDDMPKPNMYSVLVSAATRNQCDMVMGGYEKVDADGNASVVDMPFDGYVPGGAKTVAYSMAFWSGFVEGSPIHTLYGSVWPNLYKKSLIEEHHIRFPQGVVLGEDLLFNLDYLSHCDTVYMVNQSLYGYSVGNESATRKVIPDLWDRYKLLLQRCEALLVERFGPSDELTLNVARQYANDVISVIEEQIIPFCKKDAKRKIRALCADLNAKSVPKQLLKHGTVKEKVEAVLFRYHLAGWITLWLK